MTKIKLQKILKQLYYKHNQTSSYCYFVRIKTMPRLVETGQIIITESKNSIAVQTLIPSDYIEWIREVNDKVIFKIKDNIDVEQLVKDINNLQYNLLRGNYAKYT